MPEDSLVGFEFFDDNGLSIVNDAAKRAASDRLANEIAFNKAIPHLDTAINAVQTAALRKQRQDEPNREEPDWDDNVPPDLSDGFDFLL